MVLNDAFHGFLAGDSKLGSMWIPCKPKVFPGHFKLQKHGLQDNAKHLLFGGRGSNLNIYL